MARVVSEYEVYRLFKPTNTKIDTFLKGISFNVEKFIMNYAVCTLGQKICTKYIADLSIRNMLYEIIKSNFKD